MVKASNKATLNYGANRHTMYIFFSLTNIHLIIYNRVAPKLSSYYLECWQTWLICMADYIYYHVFILFFPREIYM